MGTSDLIVPVLGYMTCSSLMLLANKMAVTFIPSPSLLLMIQIGFSVLGVLLLGALGVIDVRLASPPQLLRFLPAALVFAATMFTNMNTLQHANVETLIVFRASTPLALSVLDWLVLGRELPCLRSCASLLACVCGAFGYVAFDAGWNPRAFAWVAAWYGVFIADQVLVKYIFNSLSLEKDENRDAAETRRLRDSNWDRMLAMNLVALLPLAGAGVATGELLDPAAAAQLLRSGDAVGLGTLLFSCFAAIGISYFATLCRSKLSATSFALTGNVCKVVTILLNVLVWDKHASAESLGCLAVCLVSAGFYTQAPLRQQHQQPPPPQQQQQQEQKTTKAKKSE
jgi:GDP-mannose transporter